MINTLRFVRERVHVRPVPPNGTLIAVEIGDYASLA